MELKNFWCIVTYIGHMPFYYCGYYKQQPCTKDIKPVLSSDFNDAMKLHAKPEAERILNNMGLQNNWKVEEHAYF